MARGFQPSPISLPRIRAVFFIGCISILFLFGQGLGASGDAPTTANLSTWEKQEWVRQAVTDYEQGDKAKAREGLEQAASVFPENYAVPYYLGLIYLEQGDRKEAIAQWQRYTRMAPQNETTLNIRKQITLLIRQEARQYARKAVARESELSAGRVNENTIAVTSFSNLGSDTLGPLGKGIAAMLITDLSQVPGLDVVDRIKLHALLDEMKLGRSGLVDIHTAPKVGKLLKARHITSGSLADFEQDTMLIASAVLDAEKSASIGAQEAKGVLKKFYELEKEIACQIIEDLGKSCKKVPASFNKVHTRSMPALVFYSRGLEYFDEENYDEARDMFQKAMEEDPEFDLAAISLAATPTSAMASVSTTQMISSTSAGGPSSSVAGTAVAGSTGTGTAIAAVGTAGTVGFPPVTAIVAGVAAVGGGVALAGGGGGGGDTPPQAPSPAPANLTGDWTGNWMDADGASGQATFSLTQTGDAVAGTVTISGDDCLTIGDISGSVSGSNVNLLIRSGGETVSVTATSSNTAKTMTGTWNYTASGAGCDGDNGNFSTSLTTGGADVTF